MHRRLHPPLHPKHHHGEPIVGLFAVMGVFRNVMDHVQDRELSIICLCLSPFKQARLAIIKFSEARFGDFLAGLEAFCIATGDWFVLSEEKEGTRLFHCGGTHVHDSSNLSECVATLPFSVDLGDVNSAAAGPVQTQNPNYIVLANGEIKSWTSMPFPVPTLLQLC
ncbi:hypothetical protein PG990_008945 [Apiospora arundinis]